MSKNLSKNENQSKFGEEENQTDELASIIKPSHLSRPEDAYMLTMLALNLKSDTKSDLEFEDFVSTYDAWTTPAHQKRCCTERSSQANLSSERCTSTHYVKPGDNQKMFKSTGLRYQS